MNARSMWQHSGLVLTSALSLSLMFGCGDAAVQDGGIDSGPIVDAGGADAGTDGGPACKGVGKPCTENADCCVPFHCDQNVNQCKVGTTDGGTDGGNNGCAKAGEPCATYADCCSGLGLACNGDGGSLGTICGPNTAVPTAKCATDGNPCGGDGGAFCCSGNCISGSCVAWPTCGTSTPNGTCGTGPASCANDFECCSNNVCDAGTCGLVCGQQLDSCTLTPDSCCTSIGYNCIPVGPASIPECAPLKIVGGSIPGPCGPPGSVVECDFGVGCDSTAVVDPCAQAGLVCKQSGFVDQNQNLIFTCQIPTQFDVCVVGGPSCQPVPNSSATNMQCLNVPNIGLNLCLQPCVTTADCVGALNGCQQAGDGKACITDFSTFNATCSKAYTPCNSAGTNDGLCLQFPNGQGGSNLICLQEANDGGGVGSCCNGAGTRQSGGLCASPNICQSFVLNVQDAICAQVCDPNPPAGADAGLPCDQTNGPQYCFFPGVPTSGDATGTCTPYCDALALGDAGTTCPSLPGNPAQSCTPAWILDQRQDVTVSDTAIGVCTAAPAATKTIVDTGGLCSGSDLACREGTLCLTIIAEAPHCVHMCGPVGSDRATVDNGCKTGETCFPIPMGPTNTPSTKIGFCDTKCDGGPC